MKYTIGTKVKVIKYGDGHTLTVGVVYYIKSYSGGWYRLSSTKDGPIIGNCIKEDCLSLFPVTKEELIEERESLKEKIEDLEIKIAFIDESGEKEYSEELEKAYRIMKLLKLGGLQEAKEIVKILSK